MSWTPFRTWAAGFGICVLSVGIVGALMEQPPADVTLSTASDASSPTPTGTPVPSATPTPPTTSAPAPTATHVLEVKKVVVTQRIPFTKRVVKNKNLATGTTKLVTRGRSGYRARTYAYTYRDGAVVKRTLVSVKVTRKPVAQVTQIGTRVASSPTCDLNYSGCVPIASDVDCAGGSGNGPRYVAGPVRVLGDDIYDLDADHDGIACE